MNSVLEWYRNGGPVMNAILLVAIIGLAVFLERFYTIVIRSKINGRAFIERVIQLVRSGKVEDAIKLHAVPRGAAGHGAADPAQPQPRRGRPAERRRCRSAGGATAPDAPAALSPDARERCDAPRAAWHDLRPA